MSHELPDSTSPIPSGAASKQEPSTASHLDAERIEELSRSRISTEKDGTERTMPKADPAANPPETIKEGTKATETQSASSTEDELTSDKLVRLVVEKHLPHIDRLAEWETQWMMPHPEFDQAIALLLVGAKILQENEARTMRLATQSKTDIPVPGPRPSEETERLPKLSDLDRQRRRDIDENGKNPIERKIKDPQVN